MTTKDVFPMNEMDLKCIHILNVFFLSIENFRISKMLFDDPIVYLLHTLNIVPWNQS